eukprot:m.55325 g.55325  ORF g.55325 m.55325 type:complete len:166 (+) comp34454_c0_seq1:849-1346(+)
MSCTCREGVTDPNCGVGLAWLSVSCFGKTYPVPQKCSLILDACSRDPSCAAMGTDYLTKCSPSGGAKNCSADCKPAARALLKHAIGARLNYCYCEDDTTCEGYRTITFDCGITDTPDVPTLPPATEKPTEKPTEKKTEKPNPTSNASIVYPSLVAIVAFVGCLLM